MENATDALIMAFAVFIFVIALTTSMTMFGNAKETSEHVFYMTDKTNFYQYEDSEEKGKIPTGRIVSAETIIPTLYRYYKENFNVIILDKEFNTKAVYNLEEEVKKFNKSAKDAPWLGNANKDTKLRIDIDLNGKEGMINGYKYTPQLSGGLLNYLTSHKFQEQFLEQRYSGKEVTSEDNETLELVKGNTKLWIIYQEYSQ